jgi:RimJ/RimL family protein N-acetyltransferase
VQLELRPITIDDLSLYEGLLCDPLVMQELGGPLPREGVADKLRRDVASVEAGEGWIFKIVTDRRAGTAAGSVCIWESTWQGKPINEMGWMVLPKFQGRGLGGEAVRAILHKARTEGRWDVVHAFPGITNGPSNGICRKTGFALLEECEVDFAGRILHCNHWRLDLRAAGPV